MPIFFILFAWSIQELPVRAAASLGAGRAALIGSRLIYLFLFAIASSAGSSTGGWITSPEMSVIC